MRRMVEPKESQWLFGELWEEEKTGKQESEDKESEAQRAE